MTAQITSDADRARYQFQILFETAAELSGARHPHKILEAFLLSAQGGVGAKGGFAAILGQGEFQLMTRSSLSKSLTPEYARVLRDHLDALGDERKSSYFVPSLQGELCPGKCELLLVCPLDDGQDGVLGLEESLAGRTYDEKDRQLVAGLGTLFQTSLRFSLYATRVELLNAELTKQNDTLDRQIYHLSALRDLSGEILRVDMAEIMSTFLLTLLGHFARPQGMLVLHDRLLGRINESSSGLEARAPLTEQEAGRLFYLCLAGVREKHLQPLQVEPVEDLGGLSGIDLGFVPDRGYLFMLRENMYGALLVGQSLGEQVPAEEGLLQAFVSQGVLHLKNADSFATIMSLNADLARQNEELRRTIDDLTRARDQISMLEAAGRRIAGIVHSKAESLTRVRLVDFLLIIVLSLGMALAFNEQNPRGIALIEPAGPEVPFVTLEQALELMANEDALLIDARPREFFELGHAERAVNVPAQLFDLVYMMQLSAEDPERPVVVFGRSVSRRYDQIVAAKFLGRDHERVYIVKDVAPLDLDGGTQ
ncbi:MAG: rhodanese-like domain-containing protein [Desulfomicrobium sp.]|nr:rhodanese-like domain-containing protein [Pseudomonadota bacterium]MBV1713695.1 rhodanese-like domain-containing protein [Desulfomicrobium sp.]MBU4572231.1 rhodanese-like domain-containing protein [Pseudomonadota bacterium]MBU4594209.1 rhodanese-like domain-containing protein [Pseudomonadota bacterium]MBV1721480.1 rhodanese-like domain-containing protein [Desulfomicrobium sp.]